VWSELSAECCTTLLSASPSCCCSSRHFGTAGCRPSQRRRYKRFADELASWVRKECSRKECGRFRACPSTGLGASERARNPDLGEINFALASISLATTLRLYAALRTQDPYYLFLFLGPNSDTNSTLVTGTGINTLALDCFILPYNIKPLDYRGENADESRSKGAVLADCTSDVCPQSA
jgi:hypothetical protein